jgi:hypothetical protein
MTALTATGERYARAHPESMVACVALAGREGGWPEAHVAASIDIVNEQARREEADRVFGRAQADRAAFARGEAGQAGWL